MKKFYAVFDTNVLVSSLLSKHDEFPKSPIVVTPAEMLQLVKNENQSLES